MTERKINLPRRLYQSFINVYGPVLSVFSLVIVFAQMFYSPDAKVTISWLILVSTVSLLAVFVLFDAVYQLHVKAAAVLPKVLTSIEPPSVYKNVQRILLLEPSELFGTESIISFYVEEKGIEILFGIGYVATIQSDGKIQAALTRVLESRGETFEKIKNNDADVLQRIWIKPSMPRSLFEWEISL